MLTANKFIVYFLLLSNLSISFSTNAQLFPLKQSTRNYYENGVYNQDIQVIVDAAKEHLNIEVNNNNQKKKLALVLDIDETSLSNYSRILNKQFNLKSKLCTDNTLGANLPAIKPILALYQHAIQLGIHVFFITGRPQCTVNVTRANLVHAGFTKFEDLLMRPNDFNAQSIAKFKSATREKIIKQGYVIIASIGDQLSDLEGGNSLKTFKLPNPFYYLP